MSHKVSSSHSTTATYALPSIKTSKSSLSVPIPGPIKHGKPAPSAKKYTILKSGTTLGKIAPFSTNFFEKIVDCFATVIRWMLRKPQPLAVKGAELAFAMELYRSSDDVLKEFAKGGQKLPESLPYSNLIGLWSKFLKKTSSKTDDSASIDKDEIRMVSAHLGKCASIQKGIEKISGLDDEKKQVKAYKKLHSKVFNAAKKLKEGERCYIPGTFRDENGPHYIMYEIEKEKDGYKFHAVGILEDKNSPLETIDKFNSEEELYHGVRCMLASAIDWKGEQGNVRLQSTIGHLQQLMVYTGNAGEILLALKKAPVAVFKAFNELIGVKAGLKWLFSSEYRKNFNFFTHIKERNVLYFEKQELETHINAANIRKQKISSEKTLEVFLKQVEPEFGKTAKITLKASLLEDIYNRSKKQLHKYPDLRSELQHELENLYGSIEKHDHALELDPQKQVVLNLLDHLKAIDAKDRVIPPSPWKQKGIKTSFNSLVHMPTAPTPLSEFHTVKPKTQVASKEALPVLAFDSADATVESFEKAMGYCQKLVADKDYIRLDAALMDIVEQIKDVNLGTLDDDQAAKAREALSYFALAIAHTHFALKREGISASIYHQLAVIARLHDENFFTSGGMAFANVHMFNGDFFANPYMDLGRYGTQQFKDSCNTVFNAIPNADFSNYADFKKKGIKTCNPAWLASHSFNKANATQVGNENIAMCIAALIAEDTDPKKNGPSIKDPEVATRVVEAIITDDGTTTKSFAIPKVDKKTGAFSTQTMQYASTRTAHSILEEKYCFKGLPMDISAELQLMQTAPDSLTRLKYAMGAFSKIAGIFGDAKIGQDWQRVFSIELTQNAALDRLLSEEADFALVYLDTLRGMIEDVQASDNVGAALFLMRMHRETLPILEGLQDKMNSGTLNVPDLTRIQIETRLEKMVKDIQQDVDQIEIWREKAESEASAVGKNAKVTNILRNRQSIHQQFLYHTALNSQLDKHHPLYTELDDDMHKKIFISDFILQQASAPASPLDVERAVNQLTLKTSAKIQETLQNASIDDIQDWLQPLLPPEGQGKEFTSANYPLYDADEFTVDVEKKILYVDGKAKRMIPAAVAGEKDCETVFGEAGLFAIRATYKNVSYKENGVEHTGEQYTFKFKDEHYSIVAKEDGKALIYKKCNPPGQKQASWFLFQDIDFLSHDDWNEAKAKKLGLDKNTPKPPRQYIPEELRTNNLWVHPKGRFVFSEGVGEREDYYIALSKSLPKSWKSVDTSDALLRNATKITPAGSKRVKVVNPWTAVDFKIFETLDTHDHIIASGRRGKVGEVAYKRINLNYQWDRSKKAWRVVQFPGYKLSPKKIGSFIKVGNTKESTTLFASNFNDYQIVEHSTKLPKLLLNGCEYYRTQDRNIHKKYASFEHAQLFSYDIDPNVGLKCQTPAGYLYLAYALYTQKRYTEALTYMRKAHSLDIDKSKEFTDIVEWMRNWEDGSNEGLVFKLHFEHQIFEWMRLNEPKGYATPEVQERLKTVDADLAKYQTVKDQIPSALHLSKGQEQTLTLLNEFDLLQAQENAVQFVQDHPEFKDFIDQLQGLGAGVGAPNLFDQVEEISDALDDAGIAFEEFQALAEADLLEIKGSKADRLAALTALEKSKGFRLLYRLETDIAVLEKAIAKNKPKQGQPASVATPAVSTPIFPSAFLATFVEDAPAKVGGVKEKVKAFKDAFFEDPDNEYLKEKGTQLADDTKVAIQNLDTLRALKKKTDMKKLIKQLESGDQGLQLEGYEPLKKDAALYKAAMYKLFHVKTVKTGTDWDSVKARLDQREDTLSDVFNRARFCYAANDFSELVSEGILAEKDIPALKSNMRRFLEQDTKRQQYFRALEKAKQIRDGGDVEILGPQLIQILDQKRAYDVKKDKQRALCQVFEWECGYVATPAQISNVKDMISDPNLFKQEALAGGKTTVIRNLIAKAKADGYHLSGVVTHAPLKEMHHPLFEKAAREAYGEKVLSFNFSRQTPTDVVSLTQLLYSLNQMIVEKGRVDLGKRDPLSLHHAILLKWDQMQDAAIEHGLKPNPNVAADDLRTQKELDVCNKIIGLLEEHLVLGSDEFDTISNCEEEHIFAYGGKMPLNPHKVKGSLAIMKWILTEPTLADEMAAFRSNKQWKFTSDEREAFLEKIAELVHRDVAPDLDKDELVDYLLKPIPAGGSADFFKDEVMTHAKAQELKVFKKFLQDIITESTLRKQGGVKFGRSKDDGWLVKPYESSDVCMENSQQSSEEETIWFTLCNYMDVSLGGVKADQISELVQTKQAEASKEVKSARQLDKIIAFSDTKAAKEWDANFDIPLIEVIPEQYQEIADAINNDPKLLENFLLHYVFPKNYSSKEKVGANANDLAEMVLEFYGSSGTSEVAPTFPEKIVLKDELVNQKGVNGRVLWSLIKTFQPGDIMYSSNVLQTLGDEMKEGDALIDLMPAFPGSDGKTIALSVAEELQKKGKISPDGVLRFVDRENEPRQLDPVTKNDIAMPSNFNPKKTTNILGQKDSRGTNFEMADDAVGYLTIGPTTTLTHFMQAALRMRKLPERLLSDSDKGQRLRYVLDPTVKEILGDDVTIESLLAFMSGNEVEDLKRLRFKSEKQKIEAIARTDTFKAIRHVEDYEARRIIWPLVREFFFQASQASVDAGGIPNEKRPPLEILQGIAGHKREKVEDLIAFINAVKDDDKAGLSDETIADLDLFIEKLENTRDKLKEKEDGNNLPEAKYLPEEMSTTATELDVHQTAEQEQELEAELQKELQVTSFAIGGTPVFDSRPKLDLKYTTPASLCDQLYTLDPSSKFVNPKGLYQPLRKIVPYMDEYTYYTRGAYPNFMIDQGPWSQFDPAKAGQIQIPRLLIMVDKRQTPERIVSLIGTQNDFVEIDEFAKANKNNPQVDVYVANIRNDKLDGGLYEWSDDYSQEIKEAIAQRLVQMKFLNGEIDLLKPKKGQGSPVRKEYKALKKWLISMKDLSAPAELEKTFLQFLQAYRPSQVPQYHTSAVADIFDKLKLMFPS